MATKKYTPLGTYNDRDLTGDAASAVAQAQRDWAAAKAAGDQTGMKAAHNRAESIRAAHGYSGGRDGSDYIGYGGSGTLNTTPAQAAAVNNRLHVAGGGGGNASPTVSAAAQTIQQVAGSPLWGAAQQAAARTIAAGNGQPGPGGMSTTNLDVYNQIQQMRYNAGQWANASPEERQRLQAENERIGASIPGAYRDDSGVWHYGTENLFDVGYQRPTVQVQPFSYGSVAESPMAADLYRDVQEARNRLNSRASFEYDPAKDPLYRQYADSYTRGGQRAMTDVLGQLAARTGGMASSYAGAMAQQTYDNYMADLANKVPELYQAAYNRYNDEYNRDRQAMLDVYGMYSDALGQYNTDRDFAYRQFRDSVGDQQWNLQNQYSADRDLVADRNAERTWQHGLEREAVEDQRYEAEQAADNRTNAVNQLIELVRNGYIPTQADLANTGLTMEQLQALINMGQFQRQQMSKYY